jgi:hypothetical protein
MKTLLLTTLAVALAGHSLAQSAAQRFDVPFAFHVGNKLLPSGAYSVHGEATSDAISVSAIRNGAGGAFILSYRVDSPTGANPSTATLVFTKYDDQSYFLSQAWSGTWPGGLATIKSRAERQYADNKVTARIKPVTVRVVASVK